MVKLVVDISEDKLEEFTEAIEGYGYGITDPRALLQILLTEMLTEPEARLVEGLGLNDNNLIDDIVGSIRATEIGLISN